MNGSQNLGFEELCSQLASAEPMPDGAKFYRKGTPDAGVECYWKLATGDEWAWQAKFFLSSPDTGQWRQIDDSVKRALDRHPRLVRYTICLPLDMPDAKANNQSSLFAKWKGKVAEWEQIANEKSRAVEFDFWGQHEIIDRLSREEHRGRHIFWFSEERFSLQWFRDHLEEAISDAGQKYDPQVNVELPIAKLFDSLGKTPAFHRHVAEVLGDLRRPYSRFPRDRIRQCCPENLEKADLILSRIWEASEQFVTPRPSPFEPQVSDRVGWPTLADCAITLSKLLSGIETELSKSDAEEAVTSQNHEPLRRSKWESQGYGHYQFSLAQSALEELLVLSSDSVAFLANTPAMLLVGDAGQGKTHLLCDVAERDLSAGHPRILFHAGQFVDGDPWKQMIELLGLTCNREEFLGALEASAQAHKCRVLILIDALNEGPGRSIWKKHLAGMMTRLSRTPWLGIAVSVRSSYEELVIPEGILPKQACRAEHRGFHEVGYAAVKRYFGFFGIQPTSPVLAPEFYNPLFLRVLCLSLRLRGWTQVPTGIQGITALLGFFLSAINHRLAEPDRLDYDERSNPVLKAVTRFAGEMAAKRSDVLPYEDAQRIVDSCLERTGFDRTLFRQLISEGVLTEDYLWNGTQRVEVVRITYERFSDHLLAQHFISECKESLDGGGSAKHDSILYRVCEDEMRCRDNQGLVEALCVQLPESYDCELWDRLPHAAGYHSVRSAFVTSLLWRDPRAFTPQTLRYIMDDIRASRGPRPVLLDTLLNLATIPGHPLNAHRLHRHLVRRSVAERDQFWSTFLHFNWEHQEASFRLVTWAWDDNDKSAISVESTQLAAIMLAWFCTSSHRFLRDRATKALVRLLESRFDCLCYVLRKFRSVNDPYVTERLLAAAYGCALRCNKAHDVSELAQLVYDWIFAAGLPPPHLLLRDYARGIVECALKRGARIDIDPSRIVPPYKSSWPSFRVPSIKNVKQWAEGGSEPDDPKWAEWDIHSSLLGGMLQGDFSRYVIGSLDEWSADRLEDPQRPSWDELEGQFVSSLTARQKVAFQSYRDLVSGIDLLKHLTQEEREKHFGHDFSDDDVDAAVIQRRNALNRSLRTGSRKHTFFTSRILPYLARPHLYNDADRFDGQLARRWMLQRIRNLGWTVERFGTFDRQVAASRSGRESNKAERIGKKYQWLAYHEFLARISDNFRLRRSWCEKEVLEYDGPWDILSTRDIDPSNLLHITPQVRPHSHGCFEPGQVQVESLTSSVEHLAWLKASVDLPKVPVLIDVSNPIADTQWLTLESFSRWLSPTPPTEELYESPHRELWYMIKSYLVKKRHIGRLYQWAKRQRFWGKWMPESGDQTGVFLGEFFHMPAFRAHNSPYHGYEGWTTGRESRIPVPVLVTTARYLKERASYDCSIDETMTILLPCETLVEGMDLRWNGMEGHYYRSTGELVAFDPSVCNSSPSSLLVRRDFLLEYLDCMGYDILWTVLGEKMMIGGDTVHKKFEGSMEISGAYRIWRGKIHGHLTPTFRSPSAKS